MIVKVKEPQAAEVALLEPRHTLFTYLHLAPDPELTRGLVDSGATCVAYETVEDARGRLPLLAPMSEVAGKIATQAGAFMLEKPLGGRGMLLGGVPGVAAGKVHGHRRRRRRHERGDHRASAWRPRSTSTTATSTACASSTSCFNGRASTCYASTLDIEQRLPRDRPRDRRGARPRRQGAARDHARAARADEENAVLVDVSIDQGGCFETSRPTTHSDPTYEVDGITHYCVANMPGAVPITSTYALTNATMPYVLHLADAGVARAPRENPGLAPGVNVVAGKVTYQPVAEATGQPYTELFDVLGSGRRRLNEIPVRARRAGSRVRAQSRRSA